MPSDSSSLNSTYSSVNSLQAYGENAYNLQLPNRIEMNQMSNAASHNISSNNALNINKLRKNLSQLITSAPHQSTHEGNSHFFPAGSSCEAFQSDCDTEGYNINGVNGHNYSPGYAIEEPIQVSVYFFSPFALLFFISFDPNFYLFLSVFFIFFVVLHLSSIFNYFLFFSSVCPLSFCVLPCQ